MATSNKERAVWMLGFNNKIKCATDMQRKFSTKYSKEAPSRKVIYAWQDTFVSIGSLSPGIEMTVVQ